MAKAYVFFADGLEEVEALTQVDLLRRAGVDTVTVSIMGTNRIKGAHDIQIMADILFDESLIDADMIILPGGGVGTKNLMKHDGLRTLINMYSIQNKYLAAICAAPGVFGINNLLVGRKATCYPGHEANLHGAIIINASVVEDGNFITSKGPGTSFDFALTLITKLCGKEASDSVRRDLQYER